MLNGVVHRRNVMQRSRPLQLSLFVFISCSAPAGSGPGLDTCPGSPLWHLIVFLQRGRKVTQWISIHQQITLFMSVEWFTFRVIWNSLISKHNRPLYKPHVCFSSTVPHAKFNLVCFFCMNCWLLLSVQRLLVNFCMNNYRTYGLDCLDFLVLDAILCICHLHNKKTHVTYLELDNICNYKKG